jgi:hypothetical protein
MLRNKKEETHKYNQKYYKEHRQALLDYQLKYNKENHEKKLASNNNYYHKNIEKSRMNSRNRYKMNTEKKLANNKKWSDTNTNKVKEGHRKYYIEKTYKITIKEYDILLLKQNNCCAICGRHKSKFVKPLYVDHDHKTNIIRGLLCHKCNVGLGSFNDSTQLLNRASIYLNNTKK